MNTLFADENRRNILIALEEGSKKFVHLKKALGLPSNLLSYNLKILLREELIKKNGVSFLLSDKGKYLMPYIYKYNDASLIPLPCIAVIVMKGDKILIRKKTKEPEKGKSIFIGGKMNLGEDIFEAARRHVREKTGIEVKQLKLICINNYVAKKQENIAHFITFFMKANPEGIPKDASWKSIAQLRGDMFPDNIYVLQNMLNNTNVKLINSGYDADSGKFEVVNTS